MMNDARLRKWLMREVHGVETPRKPPTRATRSVNSPARNWKYKAWIRSLPCAVCGLEPAGEAAHTGSDGGMSLKASDYSCVPLCSDCHTQAPDAYHRVGRAEFEARHNVQLAELVKRLNRLWFHPSAWDVR